ncbi:MAG: hypothetical protein N4A57_08690 [Anaeromicrobium sp.]|jgi:hypothetical protein|uniref:hypothetical protein n=1 Tax=Anaeromicrobium sp. TaxID=1929132 RepID=UPI0025E43520|nr:hypothetical protein [Anaeromicrobium sp.]MCT4594328.1 hypothetical protein [Anaeromicrobium sp.]
MNKAMGASITIIAIGIIYLALVMGLDNFNSGKTRVVVNKQNEEQKNNIVSLPSKNIIELDKLWEFKSDERLCRHTVDEKNIYL